MALPAPPPLTGDGGGSGDGGGDGRDIHSSTYQLNLSRACN